MLEPTSGSIGTQSFARKPQAVCEFLAPPRAPFIILKKLGVGGLGSEVHRLGLEAWKCTVAVPLDQHSRILGGGGGGGGGWRREGKYEEAWQNVAAQPRCFLAAGVHAWRWVSQGA